MEIEKDKIVSFARNVVKQHSGNKTEIIAMLQEIQTEFHYLPEAALNEIARGLNVTPQTVFGVATFYAQFSLDPKGMYIVKICDGTACHVKNSEKIYKAIEKHLKFIPGKKTTVDGLFTLETVACLGACGIAPVMVINETVYPQVHPETAVSIIDTLMHRELEPQEAGK